MCSAFDREELGCVLRGSCTHKANQPPRMATAGGSTCISQVHICTEWGSGQTLGILDAADRGPFHGDEWVFSSVLLPSYEKGDPVRGRLYEAIKNVCHFGLSNVTGKGGKRLSPPKKILQKWQGNKTVFNAQNGFLSGVVRTPNFRAGLCPQSIVLEWNGQTPTNKN